MPSGLLLRDDPPPLLTPLFASARRLFLFHVPLFVSRDIMPQPLQNV
jgi:hypothetical protein